MVITWKLSHLCCTIWGINLFSTFSNNEIFKSTRTLYEWFIVRNLHEIQLLNISKKISDLKKTLLFFEFFKEYYEWRALICEDEFTYINQQAGSHYWLETEWNILSLKRATRDRLWDGTAGHLPRIVICKNCQNVIERQWGGEHLVYQNPP